MKLLNYTTIYFAAILLLVISVWAGLFYYNMLDEIYDSMDDGLENQKLLVLQKAARDSTVLSQHTFDEGYFSIRKISPGKTNIGPDLYQDTLMYMQNEQDYEPIRMLKTVFRHQDQFYELRLITSMVEEDDLIEDLLYSLLWLYLGLIASILLLNNYLLKKIWQPFYRLLHYLKDFRLENTRQISPVATNIYEFKILNRTIGQLLQTNIDTYVSQKNFIENAAHELQTPLAISLNKLELLAEGNNLQEDQMIQIGSVMHHLERLTRLNKSLLLLTKIENKQFASAEEVNLNIIIGKIIADFADQATYRQVPITLQENTITSQNMNPDLAQIMFMNLVKNAIIHNQAGGWVHITIKENSVIIQNSGSDKPLARQNLFNRFQKETATVGSTGLGLAIVKAIADLYNFRLTYEFQKAHIFTVYFKYPF